MNLSLVPHLDLINELYKRADTMLLFYGKKDEDQKTGEDAPYGSGFNPDTLLKAPDNQEGNEDVVFAYALLGNYLMNDLAKRGLDDEDMAALSILAQQKLDDIATIDESTEEE